MKKNGLILSSDKAAYDLADLVRCKCELPDLGVLTGKSSDSVWSDNFYTFFSRIVAFENSQTLFLISSTRKVFDNHLYLLGIMKTNIVIL